MKQKILFSIFVFILLLGLLIPNKAFAISSSGGYTIESYDINLIVNENNTFDITETIKVNFTGYNKHGIFRKIPLRNTITRLDGTKSNNRARISNIVVSEQYTSSNESGYKVLKIGSSSQTVLGIKTYTIKYNYNIGKDPLKNADELYFNLIGDEWDTSINNVTFKITMPKSFDESLLGFSSGYKGSTNSSNISYSVDGNVISGSLKSPLNPGQALTVRLSLPDGYFVGASLNISIINIIALLFVFLLFIYCIINYFLHNEKSHKEIPTVEFYAPNDLSSAEIGYIFNNCKTNIKQSISLLFSLANKGYIQINDNNENIKVINLYPEPKEDKNIYENIPKRCVEVIKLKEVDTSLNNSEKLIMEYFFKESRNKKITANFSKFDEVKDGLISKGFIKIISDNIEEINKEKDKYKDVVEAYEKELMEYENKIKKLPQLSNYEKELYDNLFKRENNIILNNCRDVSNAVHSVEYALEHNCRTDIINEKSYNKRKQIFIISIIMSTILILSYLILRELPMYLYLIQCLMIIVTFICGIFMKYKTSQGEEIISKILGFRNFLILAEKTKLEELIMQDPSYFYNILPYTYVLNVSDKWIKKFENIKVVNNENINFNYKDISNYYRIYNEVHQSVHTYRNSNNNINQNYYNSYTDSSYSGDSFSGGGSSGGGSGGGGGGSW